MYDVTKTKSSATKNVCAHYVAINLALTLDCYEKKNAAFSCFENNKLSQAANENSLLHYTAAERFWEFFSARDDDNFLFCLVYFHAPRVQIFFLFALLNLKNFFFFLLSLSLSLLLIFFN
jgi:hypothetical protein